MIVGILFIATALVVVTRTGHQLRHRGAVLVALIAPYAIVGVLIALFNYARFGVHLRVRTDVSTQRRERAALSVRQHFLRPEGLVRGPGLTGALNRGLSLSFFRKNEFDENLVARGSGLHMYLSEPVAGLFTNMPVLGVGFAPVATRSRCIVRRFPTVIPTLVVLVLPAMLIFSGSRTIGRAAPMRYEVDFAPLIVLASLLGWIAWKPNPASELWSDVVRKRHLAHCAGGKHCFQPRHYAHPLCGHRQLLALVRRPTPRSIGD